MTSLAPSARSCRLHPSPVPSIFECEIDPTSPPVSRQTLSTDSSTLYVPPCRCSDSKISNTDPPPRLPPPQRLLTAARRATHMVCLLSAPGTHSEEELDPAASKRRLLVQLKRAADLRARTMKQSAILVAEDASEVEAVDRNPLAPLLKRRPRSSWAWAVRKCRAVGRVVFFLG